MATFVSPFSWGRLLTYPVFGFRLLLVRFSTTAGVAWYRYWHELFLRNALRKRLARVGDCVVYAQGPLEAAAALRVRRGPHQRVVMAVHFKTSQADEWVNTKTSPIKRGGALFRSIRRAERRAITKVDSLVYVSEWARQALLSWLPEAAGVPSAIIGNFVLPMSSESGQEPLGDLITIGFLDMVKNHGFTLKVLAEAKKAGRTITLDIYGMGPLKQELHQQARSLGVAEQVRFRGFRSDVRAVMPGYRAYVHSSFSETSSLAIIEAMAAGLPIVAGAVGPLGELFDDGVEGRYWPLDNPAQAAATVITLLESESALTSAAAAARKRFARDYDAAVLVPRLVSFLNGTTPSGASVLTSAEEEIGSQL
jgi:glycosyltransferase involved in cell wall biosynthesis